MSAKTIKVYEAVREDFRRDAGRRGFTLSQAQEAAVERLSRLAGELAGARRLFRAPAPVRGLYVWGPVGRGKSWLVDTFFEAVPGERKRRLHFHDFFHLLHEGVAHAAPVGADSRTSAVDRAVEELLGDAELLVFDEFHAHDAGDAMLVARLFRTLLDRRVTLVTTSNYPPSGLMPNPVYHHLFEPTIALIEERMDVLDVSGPTDFRRIGQLPSGGRRFAEGAVLDREDAQRAGFAAPAAEERTAVAGHLRELTVRAVRGGTVWVGFGELCESTTSVPDYLALAARFDTVVVDGVVPLAEATADGRQRFGNLVDVCCDRDVRLVLIGADPLAGAGPEMLRDLDRIASRLAMLQKVPAAR
ncbi:cell division protein ZapE [Kitasatospora sp. NPDC004289]